MLMMNNSGMSSKNDEETGYGPCFGYANHLVLQITSMLTP